MTADNLPTNDTEQIHRLKRRNEFRYTPFLVAGLLALLTFYPRKIAGIDPADIRLLMLMVFWIGPIWMKTDFDRVDRADVDQASTERLKTLLIAHDVEPVDVVVRVDASMSGLIHSFWLRDEVGVVVSRFGLRNFSADEIDFAMLSAYFRRRRRSRLLSYAGLKWTTGITALGLLMIAVHLLPEIAIFPVGIAFLGVVFVAVRVRDGDENVQFDIDADEAALSITGNRDAAESALSKMAGEKPSMPFERRLHNIRYAAFRQAASTLPPRGWKPR